ncbi:osmotically inducible protein OsmC [Thermoplasmatales archaeon ex4484_30]|nr:MAG: osmotically inducible protein OsmC [Thermoplasmatales archaeon ex4484_30]
MEVQIRQVEGLTFVAKGESNHWVTIDGPKEFFGSEAAPRPMELLLIALGSCTASDVASILRKKRVDLTSFEVSIKGERSKEHPKVFTKIFIEYIFQGNNLQKEHLERAIELSQNKYCPISSMLRKAVEIKYSYRVI